MSEINPTGLDAYKPAQIADLVDAAGVAKVRLPVLRLIVLAVLAGAFIGFGAVAYTIVMTGVDASFGPARFLGGIVFSLGLILVVVGGAELFTGNALMVMATVDGRISLSEMTKNWTFVYIGNFAGALGLAVAIALTGILDGAAGATAVKIAEAKIALDWHEAFMRGVLCNTLVCLAVWLALAARTVAGKILAIIWPIASFVLLGLEHSIANMYLIPQGMLAGAPVDLGAFANNLVFVTLGNIVGGAGGVALSYRLAYGSRAEI
ncbi:MAG: formate/nitrite transporter family protein [Fimbriimonadaceae bacterium]|nr:formate/nitrite transporter family protein [Alphaproteobacteria bacterium]